MKPTTRSFRLLSRARTAGEAGGRGCRRPHCVALTARARPRARWHCRYWLVLPAAGGGSRFGGSLPKQYAPLAGSTVIEHALAPFLDDGRCRGMAVVLSPAICGSQSCPWRVIRACVQWVAARNAAIRCAWGWHHCPPRTPDWVLVHDAARPCVSRGEIDALLDAGMNDPVGGVLAVPVADTLKLADERGRVSATAPRSALWRALTPQMFRAGLLRDALARAAVAGQVPTDESQAVEWLGSFPRLVPGSARNIKVTQAADLALAEAVLKQRGCSAMSYRVGNGFDVHAFGPGDSVMLGGVRIPCERGVVAHSDGDVMLHALMRCACSAPAAWETSGSISRIRIRAGAMPTAAGSSRLQCRSLQQVAGGWSTPT